MVRLGVVDVWARSLNKQCPLSLLPHYYTFINVYIVGSGWIISWSDKYYMWCMIWVIFSMHAEHWELGNKIFVEMMILFFSSCVFIIVGGVPYDLSTSLAKPWVAYS